MLATARQAVSPSARKLNPSVARDLAASRKLGEDVRLFRDHLLRARRGADFEPLFESVAEYDALLKRHAGIDLRDAQVFEIGFGARPHRQRILHSMKVDARGVDAETPFLGGELTEVVAMVRRNGMERALKSVLRRVLFDRSEQRTLNLAIRRHGLVPRLERSRLIVADAGELALPPASLDLVSSEDVFEHIERDTVERLASRMSEWIRPGGLALIRPNVFTGIVGGHLLEWNLASMAQPPRYRRSEPWEHLRKRRFAPNTYLNEMTRSDYRQVFGEHFEILEERVMQPDLGRGFLDERAREELSAWTDDELFSNQTLFVLRRPPGA